MGGGQGSSGGDDIRRIAGIGYLGKVLEGIDAKDLKGLADEGKASVGSGVVTLVGVSADGKASAVVAVTQDLIERFRAGDLVPRSEARRVGKGCVRTVRYRVLP